MNTKDSLFKTVDTWTMSPEEILIEAGLTPKKGNKTGSCIMPAPKHWQCAKPQQNTTTEQTTCQPQENKE